MDGRVNLWVAPAGEDQRATAQNLLLDLAGLLVNQPELRYEPSGRPYVDGLAVSISHSRELVAVAAALSGPVGVDVEDVYPREVSALAQRWFGAEELAWMAAQPDELTAFLHLWAAKEAVGKALGFGLRKGGLRRRMPLPVPPGQEQSLAAGLVPAEPTLAVVHVPVSEGVVLAVALPVGASDVLLVEFHGAALRRTVKSRTSFPVVVRGN
ncbi:phosphopantetheine--protein transferase-like protein [Kribbella antiqua]|uniref:Phosphopantetheine--protein transferase-like protein n=1 Tax=Kribbella antiqua TaxID=2512217 RepID=A0A4V2S4U4_9ACTN|nr:4'-phosphopantetheinyl transferase superfamily protein [Kribbella antiqua]TCO49600.1 phosphopantetheine--protein transferase-like protein [Kribbella antiqua]